jgi:hypothetical protein
MYYNKYNANTAARDLKPPTHTLQDLINYFTNQYPNIIRAPQQSPAPLMNSDTRSLEIYNLLVDFKSKIQASLGNPLVRRNRGLIKKGQQAVKLLDSIIHRLRVVDKLLLNYKI